MASLLLQVRKKMTITAHRKVRNALEGEYGSVFKGRSMDFDDLRAYVPGDDIKDIDWKATARSGQMLIKRYVAIRKHNILLVVDTGRAMAATAPSGESKRDIAVMAAGVIAYVAQKHGDLIALAAGDSQAVNYMPLKSDTPHLERILQYINSHAVLGAPESDLSKLLDYISRTIRRRMMLVVVSDNLRFSDVQAHLLRRLSAQHEIMFIGIDDLDPSNADALAYGELYDVSETVQLPAFIRRNKTVRKAYEKLLQDEWQTGTKTLEHIRVNSVRITSEAEVVSQIVRLLEKQKHAKRA